MTTAAVASPPKLKCWFEVELTPRKDIIAAGHADRIFASDDPRWKQIEDARMPKSGSLMFGTYKLDDDGEMIPRSIETPFHYRVQWHTAKSEMERFERTGKVFETPFADQMEEVKNAREKGQADTVAALTDAISGMTSALLGKGATK